MNRILEESKVHIRTIVVPVDLSAVSEKTASYAVGLARNFGASIRFLHVFPPKQLPNSQPERCTRFMNESRVL